MPAHATPQQLKAPLDSAQTYAFIDVRERSEFNRRQILDATNLPRRGLEFPMARLVPVKGTPIVVGDEGGPRAALAAATLEGMGYADVSAVLPQKLGGCREPWFLLGVWGYPPDSKSPSPRRRGGSRG